MATATSKTKTATTTGKPAATKTRASAAAPSAQAKDNGLDEMFELAADTFRVMSAPMRLKIISCLCNGEKNVGQLLQEIDTTQPNMSQHLQTLLQAGVLSRRRDGVQMYYRIVNDNVVNLCRAVCTQIAIDDH